MRRNILDSARDSCDFAAPEDMAGAVRVYAECLAAHVKRLEKNLAEADARYSACLRELERVRGEQK